MLIIDLLGGPVAAEPKLHFGLALLQMGLDPNLRGVNFSSTILHHVNFTGADIEGANFANASMKNCKALKLTPEQEKEIEDHKDRQREEARQRLAVKKAARQVGDP